MITPQSSQIDIDELKKTALTSTLALAQHLDAISDQTGFEKSAGHVVIRQTNPIRHSNKTPYFVQNELFPALLPLVTEFLAQDQSDSLDVKATALQTAMSMATRGHVQQSIVALSASSVENNPDLLLKKSLLAVSLDIFSNSQTILQDLSRALSGDLSVSPKDAALKSLAGPLEALLSTPETSGSLAERLASRRSDPGASNLALYLQYLASKNSADPQNSDIYVRGFLNRYPEHFSDQQDPSTPDVCRPTPRGWATLINRGRRAVSLEGGFLNAFEDIRRGAHLFVGAPAGAAFSAYLNTMLHDAEPLASRVITAGVLNKEKFNSCMEDGLSASHQNFAYQFAQSLAAAAALAIAQDPSKSKTVLNNFALGASHLSVQSFDLALCDLKDRLIHTKGLEGLSEILPNGTRDLKQISKLELIDVISSHSSITKSHRKSITEIISGHFPPESPRRHPKAKII